MNFINLDVGTIKIGNSIYDIDGFGKLKNKITKSSIYLLYEIFKNTKSNSIFIAYENYKDLIEEKCEGDFFEDLSIIMEITKCYIKSDEYYRGVSLITKVIFKDSIATIDFYKEIQIYKKDWKIICLDWNLMLVNIRRNKNE
jgi:hypothetical protein